MVVKYLLLAGIVSNVLTHIIVAYGIQTNEAPMWTCMNFHK